MFAKLAEFFPAVLQPLDQAILVYVFNTACTDTWVVQWLIRRPLTSTHAADVCMFLVTVILQSIHCIIQVPVSSHFHN